MFWLAHFSEADEEKNIVEISKRLEAEFDIFNLYFYSS